MGGVVLGPMLRLLCQALCFGSSCQPPNSQLQFADGPWCGFPYSSHLTCVKEQQSRYRSVATVAGVFLKMAGLILVLEVELITLPETTNQWPAVG